MDADITSITPELIDKLVRPIIRKDVDSKILADLVITLTTNIAIDEFSTGDIDYEKLLIRIDNLINIFRKGIE